LLRNDDLALVAYQSRKSIKRALSVFASPQETLSWLTAA
jgi:hypothetical protein